eukprot:14097058-Alexandrium_andersonii.AAC.1
MLWRVLRQETALLDRLCYATGAFQLGDSDPWRAGAVGGSDTGEGSGEVSHLGRALHAFGAPVAAASAGAAAVPESGAGGE